MKVSAVSYVRCALYVVIPSLVDATPRFLLYMVASAGVTQEGQHKS